MAKKMNCRMTAEERAVHDRAVSLRKMTDQQLCDTMDRQYSLGVDEGVKLSVKSTPRKTDEREAIERFIDYLETKVGSGNRIGGGTIYSLRKELSAVYPVGGAK